MWNTPYFFRSNGFITTSYFVVMDPLLPVTTVVLKSETGSNGFITTYHWPPELADAGEGFIIQTQDSRSSSVHFHEIRVIKGAYTVTNETLNGLGVHGRCYGSDCGAVSPLVAWPAVHPGANVSHKNLILILWLYLSHSSLLFQQIWSVKSK